jgi:bifunctional DNase/RNase
MQEMVIYGVSFDLVGKQPIVLLKTADGNKFLPIWIGHPEAAAILMKLQGASTPRPMTHDLVTDMLGQLDAQVVRITVTELKENTFYASITVQQDGSEIEIDSRPSDAIALAVRAEAPIFAADDVIEESAIELSRCRRARPRASSGRGSRRTPPAALPLTAAPGWRDSGS